MIVCLYYNYIIFYIIILINCRPRYKMFHGNYNVWRYIKNVEFLGVCIVFQPMDFILKNDKNLRLKLMYVKTLKVLYYTYLHVISSKLYKNVLFFGCLNIDFA